MPRWARLLRVGILAALTVSVADAQAPAGPPFVFGPADEKLLEEANQLDLQVEKKGQVYHDVEADALLDRLGRHLVANEPVPERVVFRFHIVRNPLVNAFALPNGSVYAAELLLAGACRHY